MKAQISSELYDDGRWALIRLSTPGASITAHFQQKGRGKWTPDQAADLLEHLARRVRENGVRVEAES